MGALETMSVLLIAGSPTWHSRSAGLLQGVGEKLLQQGVGVQQLTVRNLDASALLQANFSHPDVMKSAQQVARAQVLVIATPVYKAAYSGVLKVWLDLLPQTALKGKTVLPLATGGSPHHMLALDYALRPVLQALGAKHILPGIYATDAQVQLLEGGSAVLAADLQQRVNDAVHTLLSETLRPAAAAVAQDFPPVPFSQVRCSV